jgi:hypothetical protein
MLRVAAGSAAAGGGWWSAAADAAAHAQVLTGVLRALQVADIFCNVCNTNLGWKYEMAFEEEQKYKVGAPACNSRCNSCLHVTTAASLAWPTGLPGLRLHLDSSMLLLLPL